MPAVLVEEIINRKQGTDSGQLPSFGSVSPPGALLFQHLCRWDTLTGESDVVILFLVSQTWPVEASLSGKRVGIALWASVPEVKELSDTSVSITITLITCNIIGLVGLIFPALGYEIYTIENLEHRQK